MFTLLESRIFITPATPPPLVFSRLKILTLLYLSTLFLSINILKIQCFPYFYYYRLHQLFVFFRPIFRKTFKQAGPKPLGG